MTRRFGNQLRRLVLQCLPMGLLVLCVSWQAMAELAGPSIYTDAELESTKVEDPSQRCYDPAPPGGQGPSIQAQQPGLKLTRMVVALHSGNALSVRQQTWKSLTSAQGPEVTGRQAMTVRGELVVVFTLTDASGTSWTYPLRLVTIRRPLIYAVPCRPGDNIADRPNEYPTVTFGSKYKDDDEKVFEILRGALTSASPREFHFESGTLPAWPPANPIRLPVYSELINSAMRGNQASAPFLEKLPRRGGRVNVLDTNIVINWPPSSATKTSGGLPGVNPPAAAPPSVPPTRPPPNDKMVPISVRFSPPLNAALKAADLWFEDAGCSAFRSLLGVPDVYLASCPDAGERTLAIGDGGRISVTGQGTDWGLNPHTIPVTGAFDGQVYTMPLDNAMAGSALYIHSLAEKGDVPLPTPRCDRRVTFKPDDILHTAQIQPEPSPCSSIAFDSTSGLDWIKSAKVDKCINIASGQDLISTKRCVFLASDQPVLELPGFHDVSLAELRQDPDLADRLIPQMQLPPPATGPQDLFEAASVQYCRATSCCPPIQAEQGRITLKPLREAGCTKDQGLPTQLNISFKPKLSPPAGLVSFTEILPIGSASRVVPFRERPVPIAVSVKPSGPTPVEGAWVEFYTSETCDQTTSTGAKVPVPVPASEQPFQLAPPLYARVSKKNDPGKPSIPLTGCIPGERAADGQPIGFKDLKLPANDNRLIVMVSPSTEVATVGNIIRLALAGWVDQLGKLSDSPQPVTLVQIGQYGTPDIMFLGEYVRSARLVQEAKTNILAMSFAGESGYLLPGLVSPAPSTSRGIAARVVMIGDAPSDPNAIYTSISPFTLDGIPVTLLTTGKCDSFWGAFSRVAESNAARPRCVQLTTANAEKTLRTELAAAQFVGVPK